jgi:hypothetical protein
MKVTDVPLAHDFHLAGRAGAMARRRIFVDAIFISSKKMME